MLEWLEPLVHFNQSRWLDVVIPFAAAPLVPNQPGGAQDLQMLRNRRSVQFKRIDQAVDCVRSFEQQFENAAADRIGQNRKNIWGRHASILRRIFPTCQQTTTGTGEKFGG